MLEGVSASNGGSGIYCDTLSVSQYDSKVRSGFNGKSWLALRSWLRHSLVMSNLLMIVWCAVQCNAAQQLGLPDGRVGLLCCVARKNFGKLKKVVSPLLNVVRVAPALGDGRLCVKFWKFWKFFQNFFDRQKRPSAAVESGYAKWMALCV